MTNDYIRFLDIDLLTLFNEYWEPDVNPSYSDRESRNAFASGHLNRDDIYSILNIGGGGKRHLGKFLNTNQKVFEIDIEGDCDLTINLDEINQLPFDNESFDVACAFDVLEHLEQFHLMNDELCRVSKDFVLISLPNSAYEIILNVIRNRPQKRPNINRGVFSKYYGLPISKPNDRHRWWVYFQDIIRFYAWFCKSRGFGLTFWVPHPNLLDRIIRLIFGKHFFYTFCIPHVWIKIDKR